MSSSRYFYTLSPKQIAKNNKIVKQKGAVFSAPKREYGAVSLFKDCTRGVTINGKSQKDITDETFLGMLKREFSASNSIKLAKHYSQDPKNASTHKFLQDSGSYDFSTNGLMLGLPEEPTENIYEENGEVYFKVVADKYPIYSISPEGKNIHGYITGPVEAVFKLTDEGFALQSVHTDSTLLYDMYLGNPISKEKILSQVIQSDQLIELTVDQLEKVLKEEFDNEINEQKRKNNDKAPKEKEDRLEWFAQALKIVNDLKGRKIDIINFNKNLREHLEKLPPSLKQDRDELEKYITEKITSINTGLEKNAKSVMSAEVFKSKTKIFGFQRPLQITDIDTELKYLERKDLNPEKRLEALVRLRAMVIEAIATDHLKIHDYRKQGLIELGDQVGRAIQAIPSSVKIKPAEVEVKRKDTGVMTCEKFMEATTVADVKRPELLEDINEGLVLLQKSTSAEESILVLEKLQRLISHASSKINSDPKLESVLPVLNELLLQTERLQYELLRCKSNLPLMSIAEFKLKTPVAGGEQRPQLIQDIDKSLGLLGHVRPSKDRIEALAKLNNQIEEALSKIPREISDTYKSALIGLQDQVKIINSKIEWGLPLISCKEFKFISSIPDTIRPKSIREIDNQLKGLDDLIGKLDTASRIATLGRLEQSITKAMREIPTKVDERRGPGLMLLLCEVRRAREAAKVEQKVEQEQEKKAQATPADDRPRPAMNMK